MSQLPPVPAENQSPYPVAEPPHVDTAPPAGALPASLDEGIASAREAVGPLADKARQFAKDRPWATAALLGTIGLAVLNTLRGKRA